MALAVTLLTFVGCATSPALTPQAGQAIPVRPTLPADWATVTSATGDVRVGLPPWLVVFDHSGAIFANEPEVPGESGLQLMLEGPRSAEPQPSPGAGLLDWLQPRIESPGQGTPIVRSIDLPVGRGLTVERRDRAGRPDEWWIHAAAIETPLGVAFLQIDGPPGAWPGHEEDVALIPWLLEVGNGGPGP